QPNRPAIDEALYVLAANVDDVIAEARAVLIDERLAVMRLFFLHLLEHLRGAGIRVAQAFDEVAVDLAVLFFEGNRERQNLPLGQILEVLGHVSTSTLWQRRGRESAADKRR